MASARPKFKSLMLCDVSKYTEKCGLMMEMEIKEANPKRDK